MTEKIERWQRVAVEELSESRLVVVTVDDRKTQNLWPRQGGLLILATTMEDDCGPMVE